MIHNGIEYGMMQAYAEGFTILEKKEELGLNLPQIAEIWRYGSVVRSWLLDLTSEALSKNPSLDGLEAFVEDSG
jgi:6-phosphogluconate dehydrogenase